ncbi:MAG TPA: ferredoxin reductase [Pseudonocardiaceae bacterium]|jgi:ferredoxin-NADP reductase|nr:ferredoxin reductase [Pseudonocardiaceae bacterium]
MARAAVLGRLTWRVATVVDTRQETATARTIVLDVPGWPGHLAGQHVDIRVTAEDGYSAVRSYSMSSVGEDDRVEVTVEEVEGGEVSPYLTQVLAVGDEIEVRGPIGGWFVWRPEQTEPVQLIAGGSGIVPLMAMIRARASAGRAVPFRLLYSTRGPESAIYAAELRTPVGGLDVTYAYTRHAPDGWPGMVGRIGETVVANATWPAAFEPTCYVCGPTGFVERATRLLVAAGHDQASIRAERFGPSGGRSR